jgi:hypothetical protein
MLKISTRSEKIFIRIFNKSKIFRLALPITGQILGRTMMIREMVLKDVEGCGTMWKDAAVDFAK